MSHHLTNRGPNTNSEPTDQNQVATGKPISDPERFARLADAIAGGAAPIPAGIGDADLESLVSEVQRIRRSRLFSLIARAIARDIRASREESEDDHA